MRCEDIQEQIIEFVYDEENISQANAEVQEHLRTCQACREEVAEFKRTRKYLQLWKDESPLRSIALAKREMTPRRSATRYFGYAAIAAMVLICFMGMANTQIIWNKNSGIAISMHLFSPQKAAPQQNGERDYYTKSELRDLMKDTLDYTNESNYLMMQKMMDTMEQDRWRDMRLFRGGQAAKNNN
jgi:hypothetical protein